MTKALKPFSDARLDGYCAICEEALGTATTKDHAPSKCLLEKPFPNNLDTIDVCNPCNNAVSRDEEYFIAFLSAAISGTTDPAKQRISSGRRVLERSPKLRIRIEAQKEKIRDETGNERLIWNPEHQRIQKFLVKNARAQTYFEGAELVSGEPDLVWYKPISSCDQKELRWFFEESRFQPWPEVGSRWMRRLTEDESFDKDGFIVVQPGIYRFRLDLTEGIGIKAITREYLLSRIIWR